MLPQTIPAILVYCDSEATLGKAYSKMYNGKSRHIILRHDYIRQLIESGTISIVYMCMYSYIDLTNSYNVFTIIDNLHCSLAFFFFFPQYAGFACAFKYYMCIHNYIDATIFTIFS